MDSFKLVLILSHGNASVESGFLVNSSILVENMHEDSIDAQRTVYDALSHDSSISALIQRKRPARYDLRRIAYYTPTD